MEIDEPFEVVVGDHAYLITPLEDCTFDVNIGAKRLGNIQHDIEHDNGPSWVTNDSIPADELEAIGDAIEFKEC
jgi:hypothetical protein